MFDNHVECASSTCAPAAKLLDSTPAARRGQAVVELALTLPVLLLLMLGLINLGLSIHAQIVLTHAAWEGARTGATLDIAAGEGDAEIIGAAQQAMSGIAAGSVVVVIKPDQDARAAIAWPGPRGQPIAVALQYPLTINLPFPITLRLTAEATSRIEYQNPP
jgi:hypothetical protein